MDAKNDTLEQIATRAVLITRTFDAPRALVFKAWTDPAHLLQWYAPVGCTLQLYHFDFRTGGAFHHSITTPTGYVCLCKGIYQEIVVPERIIYSLFFSDKEGNFIEPAAAGMDRDWPGETIVTVTFEEYAGKTKLTLNQTVSESLAKRTGAYPGWIEMLDKLQDLLMQGISRTASSPEA